jgi:hypothetical protein
MELGCDALKEAKPLGNSHGLEDWMESRPWWATGLDAVLRREDREPRGGC